MKKIKYIIYSSLALLSTKIALAQCQTGDTNCPNPNPSTTPSNVSITLLNPLGSQNGTIEGILSNVLSWLVKLGSPIAALMIIIGGIQILTSGGAPDKFERGRKTILYTAIGYCIILIGDGIIKIIQAILQG